MQSDWRLRRLVLGALLAALLLAACTDDSVPVRDFPDRGTIPASVLTPPADALGCFRNIRVTPAAGTPVAAQAQAESRVRTRFNPSFDPQRGTLGSLLEARYVTITASDRAEDVGRALWLLIFDWTPPAPNPSIFPVPGLTNRAYEFADPTTGEPQFGCTSAVPVGATPTR